MSLVAMARRSRPELHTDDNRKLCESYLYCYFSGSAEGRLVWGYSPHVSQRLKGASTDGSGRVVDRADVRCALDALKGERPNHWLVIALRYGKGLGVYRIAEMQHHARRVVAEWRDEGLDFLIDQLWCDC